MSDQVDVEQVRPALMRFCMSMTGSSWDAEDLVQESLLRALPVFQGKVRHSNPEAYVLLVAKNAWKDILRRRRLASSKLQLLPVPAGITGPDESLGPELESAFQWLFDRLPPLQRGVYLLRDVYGYSAAETAVHLRMTEGAVKAALHRARQELKRSRQRCPGEEEPGGPERGESESRMELLRAYVAAFRLDDVPGILQLVRSELAGSPAAEAAVLNAAAARIRSGRRKASGYLPGRAGPESSLLLAA